MWRREAGANFGQQSRSSLDALVTQQLGFNLPGDHFSDKRRDRIAYLSTSGTLNSVKLNTLRERLQSAEFSNTESPAAPVKRPRSRSGLSLNRPSRHVLCQFEQEAPVTPAPAE